MWYDSLMENTTDTKVRLLKVGDQVLSPDDYVTTIAAITVDPSDRQFFLLDIERAGETRNVRMHGWDAIKRYDA